MDTLYHLLNNIYPYLLYIFIIIYVIFGIGVGIGMITTDTFYDLLTKSVTELFIYGLAGTGILILSIVGGVVGTIIFIIAGIVSIILLPLAYGVLLIIKEIAN